MNQNPTFSIIIPTYQRRQLVCDVVEALSELRYDGVIDVLVVVDGSTDGTAEALQQIPCPFPLRIIEVANGGAAHARNIGAAEASGEILLFLDDDMICDPEMIEEHARMYRHGADAVVGKITIDRDSASGFLAESTRIWLDASVVKCPLSPFDIFPGQLSVRRDIFQAMGGFHEVFTGGSSFSSEDSDLGVRLIAGCNVQHNPGAISRQRYVVGPREFISRGSAAALGHLQFIRRNPQLRQELLGLIGSSKPIVRFVYRPLSRIPFVPKILGGVASFLGEQTLKTRFRSSRTMARFVSGARIVSYWAALRAGGGFPDSDSLLVLAYHAIEDQCDDPVLGRYGIAPDEFAKQIDSLSTHGFTFVGPDEFAAFVGSGTPLPRRSILLTFDDCYSDLLPAVRDILHPRGIEAIAFPVTATRSNTNEWDQDRGARSVRLLQSDELRQLASMGVEIGSHSRSHRKMPGLDKEELKTEATGSADELVALGLPRPRFFAYPYGAWDEASMSAVRDAGYQAAFVADEGRVDSKSNPFELPRVVVLAQDCGWRFRLKTRAPVAYKRLFDSRDRFRSALWRTAKRITDLR